MNDVKLFLESCQSLVLYALVALSLGVLTASSAVALMKSVKLSAIKICRCGLLGVFFMSVMFGIGVSIGSVKVPGRPTNMVGSPRRGDRNGASVEYQPQSITARSASGPYHAGGLVGSRVPRDRNAGNTAYPITDEDITNCWRVAEMREGCEIVGRDACGGRLQMHRAASPARDDRAHGRRTSLRQPITACDGHKCSAEGWGERRIRGYECRLACGIGARQGRRHEWMVCDGGGDGNGRRRDGRGALQRRRNTAEIRLAGCGRTCFAHSNALSCTVHSETTRWTYPMAGL